MCILELLNVSSRHILVLDSNFHVMNVRWVGNQINSSAPFLNISIRTFIELSFTFQWFRTDSGG